MLRFGVRTSRLHRRWDKVLVPTLVGESIETWYVEGARIPAGAPLYLRRLLNG
jgi:hypothetical protein